MVETKVKGLFAGISQKMLRKSFEQIYKDHLHVLCLAAFKILQDKEKANDCVQELFLELWEKDKIKVLVKADDIGAYLYTCIRHKCFHALQAENKHVRDIQDMIILQDTFERQDDQQECLHENLIMAATCDMPSQPFKAFQMHVIEGKKRSEVAEEMGISINTVKTHLKTAFRIARNNIVKISKEIHPKQ